MPRGMIVKGISGFYYVKTENIILECKARGKFKNKKITPLVGDMVEISLQNGGCVIDDILPRKTELVRPPAANVDQAVVVFAAARPDPKYELLDRFLLLCEYNSLDVVICINKIDLADREEIDRMLLPYRDGGYMVLYTSTLTGKGIEELKGVLKDRITVFAGPSGVGKSSLLNSLQPSFSVKTGEISEKIGRGKQTTRHTELLELKDGGYVLDTPGFSSLDIDFIDKMELQQLFPEFSDFIDLCRFTGCSHVAEPDCAVKDAVSKKSINVSRYESYVRLFNELKKVRRDCK